MRSTTVALAGLALGCAGGPAPAPSPAPPSVAEAPSPEEGRDFAVYRSDGRPAAFDELVAALDTVEVALFGERHDDPVTHALQLRMLRAAYRADSANAAPRGVILSLEMFERDVQYILNEYLTGLVTEAHFLASARPWDRYTSDYRPMVEFARETGLRVIAANAPRRYVNRASRLGAASLDSLPATARRHLPPLPYPEPSERYRAQWDALMGEAARHMQGSPIDGQALWDAAMGHAVAHAAEGGGLVLHLAGAFHVERDTGIPETLRHYRPWTRTLTVTARPVADPAAFDPAEHAGLADFVILTRNREGAGGG